MESLKFPLRPKLIASLRNIRDANAAIARDETLKENLRRNAAINCDHLDRQIAWYTSIGDKTVPEQLRCGLIGGKR